MNEFQRLTKMLTEAQETLEMLAGGEAGMLDEGTTAQDISELVIAVQAMHEFLEDEFGEPLTRVKDSEIEDMADCWLDTASKVDARRGEA